MNERSGLIGDCLPERDFRVPVLMYHHVEPPPVEPPPRHPESYVTPDELESHLATLARRRFVPLTLAEAVDRALAGTLPPRPVVLTFDDGCRCFADHALPLLARQRAPATLFAVAGELGGSNRWDARGGERRESLLDAAALAEVAEAGVEVGCHGATHTDLSLPLAGDEMAAETRGAREALEAALGRPVETFCYPYGRLSKAARRAVRDAGFTAAVAIADHAGATAGDPWAVPRLPVRPGESAFELWLKARGLYPAWRRLPRLGLLSALRRRGAKEAS